MAKKRTCANRVVVKVSFSMVPNDGRKLSNIPDTLNLATLFDHLDLQGLAAKHGLLYQYDGHGSIEGGGCACENCLPRDKAEREKAKQM